MNKVSLPTISLIISGIIVLNELAWLSRTDLAWVIIGLAIANGLNSINQLRKK